MAQLEKTFPCLTCKREIKLERKADNSGWNKFNLDGSEHKHEKKQQQNNHNTSQTQQKLEELTLEIAQLRLQIKDLVVTVQFLRTEFVKQSKKKEQEN